MKLPQIAKELLADLQLRRLQVIRVTMLGDRRIEPDAPRHGEWVVVTTVRQYLVDLEQLGRYD